MIIIKFSSMTNAAKAFNALRLSGINSRIEKGSAGGCAFRLVIAEKYKREAAQALKMSGVPYSMP